MPDARGLGLVPRAFFVFEWKEKFAGTAVEKGGIKYLRRKFYILGGD